MTIFESLLLGIIQGITEFLPISSSGHLVIFEEIFGLDTENLKTFDIVAHLGTLFAILVYFRGDFGRLLKTLFVETQNFASLQRMDSTKINRYRKLWIYLIIGTIPAVIAGFLFENQIDAVFRSKFSVASMMILVGISFLIIEYFNKKTTKDIRTWKQSLIIGIAQAFALIPGVSRSGVTIAAGLTQGINREKAARFSFLLGSIAILGAALLTFVKVLKSGNISVDFPGLFVGFTAAASSGFLSVAFLMKFLKKHSLNVFGVYLVVMGAFILLS